ncbi:hypothetical protein [Gloeocapsa sp. PCC 73106]|uniref:hypothetical protein n=1 Tax=Gloeocapsa sp. PCC 73106 TaxID=102232 RepID=UPI001EE69011|nr:hypothetical protein [Gloeocapsa sp. PCC 73106]
MQPLKLKHTDLASQTFIDFYCQCRQGCDYLFPASVKSSVTILHILEWFLISIQQGSPYLLVKLMWKDVVGPTLGEYEADEQIEENLKKLFTQEELINSVHSWDRESRPDGGVSLILRELLKDMSDLEQESQIA